MEKNNETTIKPQSRQAMLDALKETIKQFELTPMLECWKNHIQQAIIEGNNDRFHWPRDMVSISSGGRKPSMYVLGRIHGQTELLWSMLVILFGNYDFAPVKGWIENKEGALNFIDVLLESCDNNYTA